MFSKIDKKMNKIKLEKNKKLQITYKVNLRVNRPVKIKLKLDNQGL